MQREPPIRLSDGRFTRVTFYMAETAFSGGILLKGVIFFTMNHPASVQGNDG
ncbi:hypothetical protein C7820_3947 [Paenibacillus sp. VMFN-D1]|nr:hypothetical protein C7820_3947 [Paenibacillus sp. VMFN-D1]